MTNKTEKKAVAKSDKVAKSDAEVTNHILAQLEKERAKNKVATERLNLPASETETFVYHEYKFNVTTDADGKQKIERVKTGKSETIVLNGSQLDKNAVETYGLTRADLVSEINDIPKADLKLVGMVECSLARKLKPKNPFN